MPERLFTFVQMELPWELGPADGRYLLRKRGGPGEDEPEHVVVLTTAGATRRGLLGGRARKLRTDAEPATVPLARATIVDPVSLSAESQARAWLNELDPEHAADGAAEVLNRVLFAYRISTAAPHVHEVSPSQALIVRAGFGEGEQVADGLWTDARELRLSRQRTSRRAGVLRPQERLAGLLSGRTDALLCEELTLRARSDLDAGRLALAALELERAYDAALVELAAEERDDLRQRIEELGELHAGVRECAHLAVPRAERAGEQARTFEGNADRETMVSQALERLEAALRARTAPGFALPR